MKFPESLRRAARPVRETALQWATARTGIRRLVNGLEFWVDSRSRHRFPSDYEPGAAAFLQRSIAKGAVIYNVGANVGVFALQLARWTGSTGKVIAFEPNPHAAHLLMRNLRLNGLTEQVEIVNQAISDTIGNITLHVSGSDGKARPNRPSPFLTRTEPISVPCTTLDEFSQSRGLIPDWLIMDVEGWEIAALRGGLDLLAHAPKDIGIVVELHPDTWPWSGETRGELERIFTYLGRRAVPLNTQQDPLAQYGQVSLELVLPRS